MLNSPMTDEHKAKALELRSTGLTWSAIGAQLGLNPSTIQAWVSKHKAIARGQESGKIEGATLAASAPVPATPKPAESSNAKMRRIIGRAQRNAVNTIARAASGQEVEKQSLDAAKLLLNKSDLLIVPKDDTESPAASLSDDEIVERILVCAVSLVGIEAVMLKLNTVKSEGQLSVFEKPLK